MTISHEEYAKNVAARASNQFHGELVNFAGSAELLARVAANLDVVDAMKKALFYGKPIDLDYKPNSSLAELHKRLWDGMRSKITHHDEMLHTTLGVVTEGGELIMNFINAVGAGEFDLVNTKEELGDVLWYIQLACNAIGTSIPELMTINDAKLEKRFGKVFSEDAANNRDLDAERKTLEGE